MKLNIFLLIIKILLFLISNKKNAHALRFESEPITVEPNVILLNSPASLTCNYMKSSNEDVQGLRWYITTEGYRHPVRLLLKNNSWGSLGFAYFIFNDRLRNIEDGEPYVGLKLVY